MTTPPPRCGVLLLHGFTGNPDTMRPLQAPLEALGLEVSLPLPRGHGAPSPQALQGASPELTAWRMAPQPWRHWAPGWIG